MKNYSTTKEGQHLTAVWRNGGFSASYDSFVVGSGAVLRLNFCAKNPPLRQAAKRCMPFGRHFLNFKTYHHDQTTCRTALFHLPDFISQT